jgi:glycosyltransferase involved in cell wall biosynthesis
LKRILFVCSGNSKNFEVVPFVQAQADSLIGLGHDVEFSTVKGKGALAYLSHVFILRKLLKTSSYDVIHAHYSLCGFVAYLAGIGRKTPVIVSLMGSDVKGAGLFLSVIRFFTRYLWAETIVKSEDMHRSLRVYSTEIIPNGINLGVFKHLPQDDCRAQLGWDMSKLYILFGADPDRDVKNYTLARQTYELLLSENSQLTTENCHLITLGSVPHEHIPIYLNASDTLLLTSKWEGSPNIVKEAMACGTPIVCTDVGDVRWLLEEVDGCYVTSQEPANIANKLEKSLFFKGETDGRERLIELELDSESVANRIVKVYERVMGKRGL